MHEERKFFFQISIYGNVFRCNDISNIIMLTFYYYFFNIILYFQINKIIKLTNDK
jgi:hypothetical protein